MTGSSRRLRHLFYSLAVGFFVAACGPTKPEPVLSVPVASAPEKIQEPRTEAPAQAPIETPKDEKIVVALLLPLSGPVSETGKALLRAATMALFDAYDPRLVLLPLDTEGTVTGAEAAAKAALNSGAQIVLGPLLSENVRTAGAILQPHAIPLIGFSNDRSVAAPGQYIMGFMPESEVKRVVDYVAGKGLRQFAALVPDGKYGNRVKAAYGDAVTAAGGRIAALENYQPTADAVFDPVKRLANYEKRRRDRADEIRYLRSLGDDLTDELANKIEKKETLGEVPYEAVFLPEGGALLRAVAPLLPFYEIDTKKVRLLGTGLWNDPSLLNEPPLQGALFAAPTPAAANAFLTRFRTTYDVEPPRIATLAYDAVGLVAALARLDPITPEYGGMPTRFSSLVLTQENGFNGVDGLFRFLPDGTVERMLAILEIQPSGFKVVDAAPEGFPRFGFALRQ